MVRSGAGAAKRKCRARSPQCANGVLKQYAACKKSPPEYFKQYTGGLVYLRRDALLSACMDDDAVALNLAA